MSASSASSASSTSHIAVNSNRLEMSWFGPPPHEAPTLVFLHEGLGCVSMWRDFPEKLAQATECGALIYSRLGYGNSDPCRLPRPVRFMHDEGLHVLPRLLDVTGVRKCILVGHSDGGSISLIYGGGTPAESLRGIITEAAHVFCEDVTRDSARRADDAFLKGELRNKLERHHGANTECAFRGWCDVWLDPDFVNWNIEEYLPGVRVPVLAIQGSADEYGTDAQINAIAAKVGFADVHLLPNCGHSPHRDREEEVLSLMTRFVLQTLGSS